MQKVYTATGRQDKTILTVFEEYETWIPCHFFHGDINKNPFFVGVSAYKRMWELERHGILEKKSLEELREEGVIKSKGHGNQAYFRLIKGVKIEHENNKVVVYRPRFIERFFKFNK